MSRVNDFIHVFSHKISDFDAIDVLFIASSATANLACFKTTEGYSPIVLTVTLALNFCV